MSGEKENASLPQLQEMAEGIAKLIAVRMVTYQNPDMEQHHQLALALEWMEALRLASAAGTLLAPLYAELERKGAAIDRMTKLLGEVRPCVKHDRLCVHEQHDAEDFSICKCGLKELLTSIDAEIGGK